ncbi:MAG: tRNA 2-thiouridine(34) synthase MnmA [bacterium]|nr:tRNA 2-thiouridine(34) synthase MnmA [bacterium]
MKTKKIKIAVAMSGGVDSAVAAKLLKDQGHEVVGFFLHFWKEPGAGAAENKCCSTEALLDARRVANKIGIRLYTMNFSGIFKKQVVDNFLREYAAGRTPNPCVVCNKQVKLGHLIKQAKKLGFDYVASGHYARLQREFPISNPPAGGQFLKNACKLLKAKDKEKDQSYFLYTFNQNELAHILFPLGDYTKKQVRELAKKFKLPVAEKKESQEICFIAERGHNEFLKRHLELRPGPIKFLREQRGLASKLEAKPLIGIHQGLPLYTVGQRRGIEIGGTGPYYAAEMDYKTNILYVVNNFADQILYKDELTAKNVNWIVPPRKLPLLCQAVIRYRHKPVPCRVIKSGKNYRVDFAESQRAVTPGQSVVFYAGEEILGGGIIA